MRELRAGSCPACDFLVTTANNGYSERGSKPELGNRMQSWDFLGRESEQVCDPAWLRGRVLTQPHPCMGVATHSSSSICWRFLTEVTLCLLLWEKKKETVPPRWSCLWAWWVSRPGRRLPADGPQPDWFVRKIFKGRADLKESLLSRHMDVYEATKEEQLGLRSEDFMLMWLFAAPVTLLEGSCIRKTRYPLPPDWR